MGTAGAPAPAEEAQVADVAVVVENPEGCTATGAVPFKRLDIASKLAKEELEAESAMLRGTNKARIVRIEELDGIIKNYHLEMESYKLSQEIEALEAQHSAEQDKKKHLGGELQRVRQFGEELRAQAKIAQAKIAHEQVLESCSGSRPASQQATLVLHFYYLEKMACDNYNLWQDIEEKITCCDAVMESIDKEKDDLHVKLGPATVRDNARRKSLMPLYKEQARKRGELMEAQRRVNALQRDIRAFNGMLWASKQALQNWRPCPAAARHEVQRPACVEATVAMVAEGKAQCAEEAASAHSGGQALVKEEHQCVRDVIGLGVPQRSADGMVKEGVPERPADRANTAVDTLLRAAAAQLRRALAEERLRRLQDSALADLAGNAPHFITA